LLVMVYASSVAAKDWRGILPMHSTRADVEALLGPPPPPPADRSYALHPGRYIYYLDEGEVYIVFADAEFLKERNCSSVAPGTVLLIQVTPKEQISVSSLNLDEKTFTKFDPSQTSGLGHEGFIDKKEGLVIRAFKGMVQEFVYLAAAPDQARCPGYYENPENFVQIGGFVCRLPLDTYGDIRFVDEKARLDNFAIQLMNEENAIGYIIVYAGRRATVAEAQLRANRARDYVINVRKINPQRVKAVNGGYHEELTVQLHITPADAEPPSAMSTVDPSQVEIIYEKKPRPRSKNR
jgi:hypothetical protein